MSTTENNQHRIFAVTVLLLILDSTILWLLYKTFNMDVKRSWSGTKLKASYKRTVLVGITKTKLHDFMREYTLPLVLTGVNQYPTNEQV